MNAQNMMRRTQRLFMTRCPELNRESGVNPEQQPLLYRKKGRQKPLGRQPEKGARRGEIPYIPSQETCHILLGHTLGQMEWYYRAAESSFRS